MSASAPSGVRFETSGSPSFQSSDLLGASADIAESLRIGSSGWRNRDRRNGARIEHKIQRALVRNMIASVVVGPRHFTRSLSALLRLLRLDGEIPCEGVLEV